MCFFKLYFINLSFGHLVQKKEFTLVSPELAGSLVRRLYVNGQQTLLLDLSSPEIQTPVRWMMEENVIITRPLTLSHPIDPEMNKTTGS